MADDDVAGDEVAGDDVGADDVGTDGTAGDDMRAPGLLASPGGPRAALAASALLAKHDLNWRDVIEGRALGPKAAAEALRREVGIDYLEAAESRIRQLRRHNDALEKQVSRLKTQLEAAKAKVE